MNIYIVRQRSKGFPYIAFYLIALSWITSSLFNSNLLFLFIFGHITWHVGLVSQPGIESEAQGLEARSLNH